MPSAQRGPFSHGLLDFCTREVYAKFFADNDSLESMKALGDRRQVDDLPDGHPPKKGGVGFSAETQRWTGSMSSELVVARGFIASIVSS
jgi:hypothetical protein